MIATYVIKGMYISEPLTKSIFCLKRIKEKHEITFFIVLLLSVFKGVQWLSGRVLVSRSRSCGFEPYWCHCVLSFTH